ncbi:hypothetical protein ACOSQ2_027033 [Xanthoceras sorbifolium]
MLHVQRNDVLGKEFVNVQEAEKYYHKYSYLKGFSVRKDDLHHDKNGLITIRRWVCSKEGFRENKYVEQTNRLCQPRGNTREGLVKEFVIEHSHNLTNVKHTQFLRSHRTVKESDMSILYYLKSVGVKTSQVMDHLVDQAGGYASVDHTKKDLQNRTDAEHRTLLANSDADAIIGYMTTKSETNTEFFYKYDVNEDGNLGNLFWADSMSRNDYRIFSVVFEYFISNRPLVIFVRVNHHIKTTVFGFGLLVYEKVKAYSWILKMFLLAMHGKYPISVVIDGNKTVRKAIESEMPGSIHRLCSYTQRSESINAYLNLFLNFRLKLYKFMRQVNRSMTRLHHNEMKDDFKHLNEHPILVTHLVQLEKHATEVYARGIFQLVRDEIKEEAKLSICNYVDDVDSQTNTFKKFGGGNKTWNVSYNPSQITIQCSCKMFQAASISCSHSFSNESIEQAPYTGYTFHNLEHNQVPCFCCRLGSLGARCSKMCYFASQTINGIQKAKLAINSIFHVKDPPIVTTKGLMRRNKKKKTGSKPRNCGRCE